MNIVNYFRPTMAQTMNEPSSDLGRRERKRQQQLAHLAQTAWELFETEGLEKVTMERIAEAADVSKVTLYKHFPAKEALLSHVMHRKLWEVWPQIQAELAQHPVGRPRLQCLLERHALWCESHREYLLPYVLYRLNERRLFREGSERSGFDRIFAALIAEAQEAGAFRSDRPAAVLAHYLQFAHLGAMLRWLMGEDLSLTEEIRQMLELVCTGMEKKS